MSDKFFNDEFTKKFGGILFLAAILLCVVLKISSFPLEGTMTLLLFVILGIPVFIASSYRKNDSFKVFSIIAVVLSIIIFIYFLCTLFGLLNFNSFSLLSSYSSLFTGPSTLTNSSIISNIFTVCCKVLVGCTIISFFANLNSDDGPANIIKVVIALIVCFCTTYDCINIFQSIGSLFINQVISYLTIGAIVLGLLEVIFDRVAIATEYDEKKKNCEELEQEMNRLKGIMRVHGLSSELNPQKSEKKVVPNAQPNYSYQTQQNYQQPVQQQNYQQPVQQQNYQQPVQQQNYQQPVQQQNYQQPVQQVAYQAPVVVQEQNFQQPVQQVAYQAPVVVQEQNFQQPVQQVAYQAPVIVQEQVVDTPIVTQPVASNYNIPTIN